MVRYVFLEGLPGVGKTTILEAIKDRNLCNVHCVDEIVNREILDNNVFTERAFLINETMKLEMFTEGLVIIDRGPISLLSYSQVKKIINKNYDIAEAQEWFNNHKKYLEGNSKVIYLTNNQKSFCVRKVDESSPYGSIKRQKILEDLTISNLKKYAKNYLIREYFQKDIDGVIDEIIN